MGTGKERKPRRGRRDYLNDFHPTAGGEYVYTGALIPWPGKGMGRREALLRVLLPAGTAFAAAVAGGCVSNAGLDGRPYVLLPYVAGLILSGSLCWAAGRLAMAGEQVREYVYRATVGRLPGLALATAVCAGVTLAGQAVNLLAADAGAHPLGALGFALLEGVLLAASLVLRRQVNATAEPKKA